MKRRRSLIYISIVIILISVFFFYKYFINIYETNVKTEPGKLFADNQSEVTIILIPVNSFGWRALFRTAPAQFEIVEGKSLVEIKLLNEEDGKMVLKAKQETGMVVVKIKSKYSLFPMTIEIPIYPNFT